MRKSSLLGFVVSPRFVLSLVPRLDGFRGWRSFVLQSNVALLDSRLRGNDGNRRRTGDSLLQDPGVTVERNAAGCLRVSLKHPSCQTPKDWGSGVETLERAPIHIGQRVCPNPTSSEWPV
jgi:hypothetical protein